MTQSHQNLLTALFLTVALAGCATVSRNTPIAATPGTPGVPVGTPPAVKPMAPIRPPRVALALGGGAARGFAHIGVIQALEENGIKPSMVVGTSAGSLVATLYASGKSGKELAAMAETMDEVAITDWTFPGRGFLRGEALGRYVKEQTNGLRIEQMKVPLGIVATDLGSGDAILFQRGDPGVAVRASSAVPAVFQSVKIGDREYVDGGLVSPVPVQYARQMGGELVIAVDISAAPEAQKTGNPMAVLLQTFAIMGKTINRYELNGADIVLHPQLDDVSGANFGARNRSIAAGREAALAALPQIKARIAAGMKALN